MALAFLAACLSSLIASQPIANQPAFAGEVGGRVIDAISGAPIADVTVMLSPTMFPPGAAGPLQAITGENGTFRFQRLAAGRYRLQAQRPGFAALAGPFDERALDVAAGQTITGLELALRPGATIAGRVLDASGGPASGLTVSALRRVHGPDGQVVASTARVAQTDDRGEFQLIDVPDGEYMVVAAPVPPPAFAAPSGDATVMAPTYYPGTADRAAAQVITLAPAETKAGVQFAMVSQTAHHLSGIVVDDAGAPVAHAIVMLRIDPRAGGAPTPATGVTDEAGAFRIGGLVPGTYQIMIGGGPHPARETQAGVRRGGVIGGVQVVGAGVSPSSAQTITLANILIGDANVSGLTIVVSTTR
jgi:hypothetical protein